MTYQAITIGASTGAFQAFKTILSELRPDFSIPLIIIVHRHKSSGIEYEQQLNCFSPLEVQQASQNQSIEAGKIYLAPPDYHLLIEENRTFSFSLESQVNFARPSIDVTFESAANIYQHQLVGVVLTGANRDGSAGLKKIKDMGGLTIVQTPDSSEVAELPKSAIDLVSPSQIIALDQIGETLNSLNSE